MPFKPVLSEREQGNFKLGQDIRSEFIRAARSNQTRLAMEYLVELFDSLIAYTDSLEARIIELESGGRTRDFPDEAKEEADIPKPAPRKATAKKAAPKPEAKNDEDGE
jgi:hypothetical protein